MLENYSQTFVATPGAISKDGSLSNPFRIFLQALWNRTGQGTGIPLQVANALAATGSSQATALQLNVDINEVLTVPPGSGVLLLPLQAGQEQQVFNGDGGNLLVYPASGYSIDALAVNAAYTLAAGKTQIFTAYSPTQLRSRQLG